MGDIAFPKLFIFRDRFVPRHAGGEDEYRVFGGGGDQGDQVSEVFL